MSGIKLPMKNRVMSWLLSPGAYAVWRALQNPEEWDSDTAPAYWLDHKPTRIRFRYRGFPTNDFAPLWLQYSASKKDNFSYEDRGRRCFSWMEEQILNGAASKVIKAHHAPTDSRTENNRKLFVHMTQLHE
jgi:hypothetical protein